MNIIDSVGNTPLITLKQPREDIKLFAKAEYFNPSGSVKDRAACRMLAEAIKSGRLTKDKIILDSTSGNTGIAYALFGAAMGYKVELCMPANASIERKKLLSAYGAKLIETDPLESSDGAYLKAVGMAKAEPDKYFFPDQYNNDFNWKAHYDGTAPEILAQTGGKITHFVSGAGTSGTFTGTSKRLKQENPGIKAVLMQPDSPFHGLEGMKHMETTIQPGFFDRSTADSEIEISTENAYKTVLSLAKEEGLFVGVSSGANVYAARKIAETAPANSVIVTILCDNGYRYLTEPVWRDL